MSEVTLIECWPKRPSDGVAVPLRLVANARQRADYFSEQWLPLLADLPATECALGFDGFKFGSGATPAISPFAIALDKTSAPFASMIWKGAEVTVKAASWPPAASSIDPADGAFSTRIAGIADGVSVRDGKLSVTLLDAGQSLLAPVEPRKFGSSGVALLDAADASDKFGETVPRGFGVMEAVPGILVDKTNGIYLLLANPSDSVQGFEDGGYPFTIGTARANLAALIANIPADGTVDYCLDAGGLTLARPWTAPTYPFTADLTVNIKRVADIANAILTARTGLSFKAGSVAAFNAAQGSDARLPPVAIGEASIADVFDRLFAGVGAWWKLTSAGEVDCRQWDYAAPVVTFGSHQIISIQRRAVIMPTKERSVGYRRNGRVHSDSDIAKALPEAITRATTPPTVSEAGQGWIDPATGHLYVNQGPGLTYGGEEITFGGVALDMPWVLSRDNSAINFDTRNDRIATAVAAPQVANGGTELTFTSNADGSCDLTFRWSHSSPPGDIDGFEVRYHSAADDTPYVIGSDPESERTLTVASDQRSIVLAGVPINRWYTFGVRAYRVVDGDIAAGGVLRSMFVQPVDAAKDPFQPAPTPDFTGTFGGQPVTAITTQTLPIGIGTSDTVSRVLKAGESVLLAAQIRNDGQGGTSLTLTVKIMVGVGWGTPTQYGATGSEHSDGATFAQTDAVLTNTTAGPLLYLITAVTTRSVAAGAVDGSQSFLIVGGV